MRVRSEGRYDREQSEVSALSSAGALFSFSHNISSPNPKTPPTAKRAAAGNQLSQLLAPTTSNRVRATQAKEKKKRNNPKRSYPPSLQRPERELYHNYHGVIRFM